MGINDVELDALRYFTSVASAGSFVAGARRAHVSPPAISKAVKKLEEAVGVRLFDRTTRRVSLTPAGRRLLEHASRILEEVERLDGALLSTSDTPRGRLHIGAMEVFSIELLPQALVGLLDEHPAVVPCCHEMIPQRMVERLLGGDLDVAFTIGAVPIDGIELHALGASPGRLVCGPRHPLHRRGRVTRADLQRYPSVVPRFLDAENLPSLDQFPEDRHPRRIGATIELLQMGVELAIRGSFLGFFPEISVHRHLQEGRLRALAGLSFGPPFKLHALVRAAGGPKAAVRPLIDRMRRLVRAQRRERSA